LRKACVLLQRTTAKEQQRRLIAALLPQSLVDKHGAVCVENHLNMLLPTVETPPVSPAALAAFLNSSAADAAFRCISGTVAVSAYELEALPLPLPRSLAALERAVRRPADKATLNALCDALYE
jgi:adenine-specific DNA-methyltransferase